MPKRIPYVIVSSQPDDLYHVCRSDRVTIEGGFKFKTLEQAHRKAARLNGPRAVYGVSRDIETCEWEVSKYGTRPGALALFTFQTMRAALSKAAKLNRGNK